MSSAKQDLELLRHLAPSDHGLTVFDADAQETSYGTLIVDDVPLIFDTHRKDGWFVSTAEVLTEVVLPVRARPGEVRRFSKTAGRYGMQAIPYTACFFKGNLHVYAYHGPLRGLDLSCVGDSVRSTEEKLDAKVRSVWDHVPMEISHAQKSLLRGTRKPRYSADLDVLIRCSRNRKAARGR